MASWRGDGNRICNEPASRAEPGRLGARVGRRMDPQPPPLDGGQPPLPPPVNAAPPAPPAWPPPAYQELSGPSLAVRWTLGAIAFLLVAAVLIFLFVGRQTPAVSTIPAPTATLSPASSPSPSGTPVSAAVATAGQLYLAAV